MTIIRTPAHGVLKFTILVYILATSFFTITVDSVCFMVVCFMVRDGDREEDF